VGRKAGRRSGRARKAAGGSGTGAMVDEASRLGFQPSLEPRHDGEVDIVLNACPFADVAAADPKTVCQLHLGIAEGLAASIGGLEVTHLHVADPFAAGCRIGLRPTGRRSRA
jgi:predicted ArsR family transcriptional regulator